MEWEKFWKLDDKGRRLTTGLQLSAFRLHFPDRIVEAKPEIRRPLIIVLEKPYTLVRCPGADHFEQKSVRLRDLNGWPPHLSLSRFGHFPRTGEGDFVDAKVVPPEHKGGDSVLVIRGEFEDQEAACAIAGYPAVFLECVARTLNGHSGEGFGSLSDLELIGVE